MLQKRQLEPARALKQHRSRLKNNVPLLRTAEGYPDLCHGDGWPISTRDSGSHFPFPSLFSPLFLQPFQPHATPLLLLLLPVPPPPSSTHLLTLCPVSTLTLFPFTHLHIHRHVHIHVHVCTYICMCVH